ncbi:MAG: hypothetical protein GEU81_03125 [Nitriliruptorales bacterium]|nr:hypothetical protein [Nitriliruptorales bacterium]
MSNTCGFARLGLAAALAALAVASCEPAPQIDDTAESTPTESRETTRPTPEPTPSPLPPDPPEDEEPESVTAYGVSAGHSDAVDAGMGILADGGNAVDAAIATAYAVSVVEPFASGIGGGGAAIVAELGEDPVAYDYREVVPNSGQIPASETGIPGFVAGMEELHAAHGTGDLADLIAPAIALAADGVATSGLVADQLRSAAHRLPVGGLAHLYPGGGALSAGAPLVQEELAGTLEAIAAGARPSSTRASSPTSSRAASTASTPTRWPPTRWRATSRPGARSPTTRSSAPRRRCLVRRSYSCSRSPRLSASRITNPARRTSCTAWRWRGGSPSSSSSGSSVTPRSWTCRSTTSLTPTATPPWLSASRWTRCSPSTRARPPRAWRATRRTSPSWTPTAWSYR